jgi:CRISPR-associated exonuclease Cas4
MSAYAEEDLLPLSGVAHIVFCERRAALHHVEGLWEDNVLTVEGSHLHERSHELAPTEVRPGLRIARALRLRSLTLGLSGIADVVEFREVEASDVGAVALPGVGGRFVPYPVEYKRGKLRDELSFKVQACAQAMCLEEMLGGSVPEGAVFYGKSARRLDVTFDDELREHARRAAARFHELVAAGATPGPSYGRKCESCSMIELCLPKALSRGRSVARYLSGAIADDDEEARP